MQNPFCSGKRCEHEHGEVRVYSRVETLRNITKLRLCQACWTHENSRGKPLDWSKASIYEDGTPHLDLPLSYTRSSDGATMTQRQPFVYLNSKY